MLKHLPLLTTGAILASCLAAPALGQWLESATLLPDDGAPDDYFGFSVAVSGDTVVVGAGWDDDSGSKSGSAYVFQNTDAGWVQVAKLVASDAAANDWFGWALSVSGSTAVIAAAYDDDNGSSSGSAYVFEEPAGGWAGTLTEDAKLLASDGAATDQFGCSVSASGDTVVVGAHRDGDNGSSSGSAYVFERPVGGWSGTLNEVAKLLASDGAASDWFGHSVSVFDETIVVGAYQDDDSGANSGAAYVFRRPTAGWAGTLNEVAKLLASDGAANDVFGISVSVFESAVVVGANGDDDSGSHSGSAYVFVEPVGGWSGTLTENAKLLASDGAADDWFGYSVSAFDDAVVVGAHCDDDNGEDSGSAYVFLRPVGGWAGTLSEGEKLLASDGAAGDYFGVSVSSSSSTVITGAPLGGTAGSAFVFTGRQAGDLDCDGAVNLFDIDPFVLALTSASNANPFDEYYDVWPDCNPMLADVNDDGTVSLFDIDPFVELLTGG